MFCKEAFTLGVFAGTMVGILAEIVLSLFKKENESIYRERVDKIEGEEGNEYYG